MLVGSKEWIGLVGILGKAIEEKRGMSVMTKWGRDIITWLPFSQ